MKKTNRWAPPGWPWELELLAFIFVLIAILVPIYLNSKIPAQDTQLSLIAQANQQARQEVGGWQQLQGFFWALALVGLYVGHLIIAGASIDVISTPFPYLFSPMIFALITYYRLYQLGNETQYGSMQIVSGSPLEVIAWVTGVMVITFLVARIRMARHMLKFRNVDWDLTSGTQFDSSYFELLAHFHPLVYPPRLYRACPDGILVEGWLYAMPLPFDNVQSADATHGSAMLSNGLYLATSARSLIRIRVMDKTEPIFISPKDHKDFLHYCEQRLAVKKTGTRGGESKAHSGPTADGSAPGTPARHT